MSAKTKAQVIDELRAARAENHALAEENIAIREETAALRTELAQLRARVARQSARAAEGPTGGAGGAGGAPLRRRLQVPVSVWVRICAFLGGHSVDARGRVVLGGKDASDCLLGASLLDLLAVAGTCRHARAAVQSPELWPKELDLLSFDFDYRQKHKVTAPTVLDGAAPQPRLGATGFFCELLFVLLRSSPAAAAQISALTLPGPRVTEPEPVCQLLRLCSSLRVLVVKVAGHWTDEDQRLFLGSAAEARAPLRSVTLAAVSGTTAAAALRLFPSSVESLWRSRATTPRQGTFCLCQRLCPLQWHFAR